MDGYAVQAADVQVGRPLRVRAHLAAGADDQAHMLQLGPNECARIFTGAALPQRADAVLIQENTSLDPADPDVIIPSQVVSQGPVCSPAGPRLSANDLLLDQGQVPTRPRQRCS